jgi:glyoxylase-like metal-dependent hydrolase (beta-lactamase superfamily II)
MPNAPYRIYAVRYAHRACTTSEAFYGDYHRAPMTMDYFVWALTNGRDTVVVDLGFTEAVGTRRGRQFLRCPGKGLSEIGVEAASVKHVILSHFHYDHVGNYALFPNATFYSVEVEDVCALVRLNYARRMQIVDGSREIEPGIAVHHVGGHTAGMQIVTVAHAKGQAVVASDASHYYRNFEENIPFNTLQDLPRMYSAFGKIRELASSPDLVLPGHDPLVLERLKRVGDGIVEM